jgi:hypothetical protein
MQSVPLLIHPFVCHIGDLYTETLIRCLREAAFAATIADIHSSVTYELM